MVYTDYELNRMLSQAISVFIGQEYAGFDSSTNTPSPTDTTLDSELGRFAVDSVTLNTSTGTYTVLVRIPLLELDGETIRRTAWFDAISSGEMGLIENLPSAYTIDTVHEVRVQISVNVQVLDSETTFITTESSETLITESGLELTL
jgi:hypothetical protein